MLSLPLLNQMPALAGVVILGGFGLMVILLDYLSSISRSRKSSSPRMIPGLWDEVVRQ